MTYEEFEEEPKKTEKEKPKKLGDHAEILAGWIVDFISIPVTFVAHIIAQFVTPGSSGTRIIGAFGFFIGTLLSTDSIWQTLFQGVPLFPWFEREWIGWIGWVRVPFNLFFWLSFGISALVQIMEAKTLRGKDPRQAKSEFEDSKQYALGSKPSANIDLTKALWKDYKRAGMRERNTGGTIALFFWIFDITTTFVGRNPWRYTNPTQILACLVYNFASMMAGEIGYSIWKLTKK